MTLLDIESWLGSLGIGLIILGIILVLIWIWAIVDIASRPRLSLLMKIIWIAVVIGFPFVGVILYLIFGRKDTVNNTTRNDTTRY